MFPRSLVLLLSTTASLAQIHGVHVQASLATPSSQPHTTVSTNDLSSYLKQCLPGDLIPGPTCTSFFKCVGGPVHATRRVRFECAAGTVFSGELGTCVHGQVSQCVPQGPTTVPPVPTSPPAPTWTHNWPTSSPAPPSTGSCPTYQLDPATVYECLEPGSFQSHRDCVRFYRCIVTMGCVIKGFLYQCPTRYLFDDRTKRCRRAELLGPCEKAADAGVQTYEIKPVVKLQPEKLDLFFSSLAYWDFMPFLPNEPQKIVPIKPSNFSRGAGTKAGVFMIEI